MTAPCSTPSAARPGPGIPPRVSGALTNGGGAWVGPVFSTSKSKSGFDVGAGVEYAFTPNWVGRVEYRYYDFGSYNVNPWVATFTPFRLQSSVNTVRVGLAYLFSSPAPVLAKY